MMAGYEVGKRGAHAYFHDRFWQQQATRLYFKHLLPKATSDPAVGTTPTVRQTPGGAPVRDQLVNLGYPTRQIADSHLSPEICDTSRPSPAS